MKSRDRRTPRSHIRASAHFGDQNIGLRSSSMRAILVHGLHTQAGEFAQSMGRMARFVCIQMQNGGVQMGVDCSRSRKSPQISRFGRRPGVPRRAPVCWRQRFQEWCTAKPIPSSRQEHLRVATANQAERSMASLEPLPKPYNEWKVCRISPMKSLPSDLCAWPCAGFSLRFGNLR
jgi:hypothetical protein